MAKTFEQAMKEAMGLINTTAARNSMIYQNNFTALQMGDIAARTPIKDGFSKGNWDAGYDDTIKPTRERDKTKTGLRARRKALKQLSLGTQISSFSTGVNIQSVNGRTTYIKNGVEGQEGDKSGYIIQLEHGKSRQAPNGMVLISINRAHSLSKKALKLRGSS